MKIRIWWSAIVALLYLGFAFPTLYATSETQFGCGFEPDSAWNERVAAFKKTDTVRVIVIWASGPNPPAPLTTKLPVFWRDMWDSSKQLSVPRFYRENSDRKYFINADVYTAPDSSCFVSSLAPSGNSGGEAFVEDVLTKADPFINFKNYDRNGDRFVDFIFIMINDTAHKGVNIINTGLNDTFFTADSFPTGLPMMIVNSSGVTARAPSQEQAVQLACHEWGHGFGCPDYYARFSADWWKTGSFSVMGFTGFNFRASPFIPFQQHNFW